MRRALALAALLGAGCIPEEGPTMEPGAACLECHGGGGGEEDAVAWTVAGTWNGQGQRTFGGKGLHVSITDSRGKSFTIKANEVGNFYTREPVVFPLTVAIEGRPMTQRATHGDCNRCHGYGDGGGD